MKAPERSLSLLAAEWNCQVTYEVCVWKLFFFCIHSRFLYFVLNYFFLYSYLLCYGEEVIFHSVKARITTVAVREYGAPNVRYLHIRLPCPLLLNSLKKRHFAFRRIFMFCTCVHMLAFSSFVDTLCNRFHNKILQSKIW